jgi:beta-lactam-binding protein with PASTA domain
VLTSLIAVMALVVLGSTWWVTLGRYTEAPQLLTMSQDQAVAYAKQQGFDVNVGDGQFDANLPKGSVKVQDPGPGDKIVKGDTITIILSLGPEVHAVPDLEGQELAFAKAQLEAIKLKVKQGKGQYSDTAAEGLVLSTDPKAGTELKPGDTVTLILSKGKAPIVIPDLVGQNINNARTVLAQRGLQVAEQFEESDKPADEVLGQSPKAGTGVEKNTQVTLRISKGPAQIVLQDVTNRPCQEAANALQGMGLQAQMNGDPNSTARQMNPGPGTPVPPNTVVQLVCFL